MKTLILNGSPRVNGDTSSLIQRFCENVTGEYKIVDAYRCDIAPCIDCRYCWEHKGCFCSSFFRNENSIEKPKKGAVFLVGGGDGRMEKAYETACTLLHHMNCHDIHKLVSCHNTNERPAIEDELVLAEISDVIRFFCGISN